MGRYFYKQRPYLFPMPFCKNQAERQELYENQDSLRERVSDT